MTNVANWVEEQTVTTGTGAVTIGTNPITGSATFQQAFGSGTTDVWYSLESGDNREAGIGSYNGTTNVLTRTTVMATLVSGTYDDTTPTPINLTGTSTVRCTFNATAFNRKVELTDDNIFTGDNQFLANFDVGDPGTETGGVLLDGILYPSIAKFNRFGTGNTAEVVIHRHSTVDGSNLVFSRALSNDSSHANVIDNTVLGDFKFTGWGDSSYWTGAVIQAVVDGTPGVSDMPTQIDFLTSADGSFTPTLRMSIRANGTVEVAGDMTVGGSSIVKTPDAAAEGSTNITHMVGLTQAEYDGSAKNANTLYVIVG